MTGSDSANAIAAAADVILAVGTRLQDFTTGSWTAFAADARIIGLNAARHDAAKHLSLPLVCDAQTGLQDLGARLAATARRPTGWPARRPNAPPGTPMSRATPARATACRPMPRPSAR